MEIKIEVEPKPCPECHAPLILVNGRTEQRIVFSGTLDKAFVTPHEDGCDK